MIGCFKIFVLHKKVDKKTMQPNDHIIRNYDLILDETFGKQGTPERTKAEEEAYNFYSELILQSVSKEVKP